MQTDSWICWGTTLPLDLGAAAETTKTSRPWSPELSQQPSRQTPASRLLKLDIPLASAPRQKQTERGLGR